MRWLLLLATLLAFAAPATAAPGWFKDCRGSAVSAGSRPTVINAGEIWCYDFDVATDPGQVTFPVGGTIHFYVEATTATIDPQVCRDTTLATCNPTGAGPMSGATGDASSQDWTRRFNPGEIVNVKVTYAGTGPATVRYTGDPK